MLCVDIYSVVCWAFHILARRFDICWNKTPTDLFHRFFWCTGRHIICWVRGEEEKLVSTANDWPGNSLLLWSRKEIRKTAGRLIVSFQRGRRPRYANQRMPMNRVETSKHTHTQNWYISFLFMSIWWWYYSSPFNECARHLSLNTSRHRAHSTALSKGWTRVLVWLDPGLLLLLLKLH